MSLSHYTHTDDLQLHEADDMLRPYAASEKYYLRNWIRKATSKA